MQLPAQFFTLLATFASSPDLCADVYLDEIGAPIEDSIGQTLPRYCQWAGPDAAELDAEVCCTIDDDGAHCSLPDPNGRCALGFKMYCAFGNTGGGGVSCLQPYPSACDNGYCGSSVAPPTASPDLACCYDNGCYPVDTGEACGGIYFWCEDGVLNDDGTMECLD